MATLAEIKRAVQPGAVYDVTNHYIKRPDHPHQRRLAVLRRRPLGHSVAEGVPGPDGCRRDNPALRGRRWPGCR